MFIKFKIETNLLIVFKYLTISIVCFRYDDKYWLSLTYKDSKTGTVREAESCKSVAHYIDENGTVVYEMVEPEVSKLHNSLLSEKKEK